MNKYQEALDGLVNVKENFIYHEGKMIQIKNIGNAKLLQELVDRATPIKPTFFKPLKTFNGSDIEQPFYIIKCGKCEYWLETSDKFCSNCGSKIEWSKYEPK